MLDSRNDLWAVVLAGGEGDSQTLLRHTLDRVARLIPPSRTVAVTQASHAAHVAAELAGHPAITVLAQPCDRGTAAGVLLAAHWIRSRAPGAVVAVFPTKHFIAEESIFMSHVAAAGAYVREHPGWLLLLGVHPSEPAPEHGWIEPGEPVGWTGHGPVHRVRAFHDKPPADLARRLHGRALCNTSVFTATAGALVDAGLACLPLLHDRLTRFELFTGTRYETIALQQAYLFAPTADFSRAVLASADIPLAVVEIPAVTWWDLGTPERVARSVGVGDPRE
jgi:mannose-1-phosphate guanylyltransferase